MSPRVGYEIALGDVTLKGGDPPETELVAFDIRRGAMATEGGTLVLHAVPDAGGNLLGALAGAAMDAVGLGGVAGPGGPPPAFETSLRGVTLPAGAEVTVRIEGQGGMAPVLSGPLAAMDLRPGVLVLTVATGLATLAAARSGGSWRNRPAGQIVRELAGAAGVPLGLVEPGDLLPVFTADPRAATLTSLQGLAARLGLDLWIDAEGRLRFAAWRKVMADHILRYRAEILSAGLTSARPAQGGAGVVGEGAAPSMGPLAAGWVVKDPAGVSALAGAGATLPDGAIRSRAAADRAASARAGGMRDRARVLRAVVLGNPAVGLMDAVETKEMPRAEMNGIWKVTGLRHRFASEAGFLTEIEATSTGGAELMGGMLGALGGLAGGLGL